MFLVFNFLVAFLRCCDGTTNGDMGVGDRNVSTETMSSKSKKFQLVVDKSKKLLSLPPFFLLDLDRPPFSCLSISFNDSKNDNDSSVNALLVQYKSLVVDSSSSRSSGCNDFIDVAIIVELDFSAVGGGVEPVMMFGVFIFLRFVSLVQCVWFMSVPFV